MTTLLAIDELRVTFRLGRAGGAVQRAQAVGRGAQGVSFAIEENQTVALVGESGSGKSVTAMSILALLPENAERSGSIVFRGRQLLGASRAQLQALRGKDIACVFQDPMSSLNPVFTVGRQICEPLQRHLGLSRREALASAEALLAELDAAVQKVNEQRKKAQVAKQIDRRGEIVDELEAGGGAVRHRHRDRAA